VVFIDRWSFYTGSGSTVIVHHKNNNVLIPPVYKHIMEKFTIHILSKPLYSVCNIKLHNIFCITYVFVNK